ncbi:hypothetical protein MVI01_45590 [Myxococcus virescens]|uniref:Uncharacterized protein n=1 Tax=Myxococcus virescens TaxID=83456 RepID=A0A511HH23_9BACT|nr:hypothetical protein MVI01_45590 [Myxococcus virescens]SDD98383.1 hypothetical protein SAMN04488504_103526 [Myxococcus virescens]
MPQWLWGRVIAPRFAVAGALQATDRRRGAPSIAQGAGASEPCLHARRYGDDAILFSSPRSS